MTLSDHFRRSIKALVVVMAFLLASYFWLRHRVRDVFVPPQIALPKNDKEVVTYDENRHRVGTTTAEGTTWQYSRSPTVEIRKDGTVMVDANKWGAELRPFLGVGYSDTGRAYAGCQLFYFHQFDAAASFGWTADNRRTAFQPMLSVAYNLWSNTSINVGANPISFVGTTKPEIAVFLSVRL